MMHVVRMCNIPASDPVSELDKIYELCGNVKCFVYRIEFLIIPAVALALLINHEFTVLEVRSTCFAFVLVREEF
jgi:hypothetical protein